MIFFKDMPLKEDILKALKEIDFVAATPIQEQTIPYINSSKEDLIALAQTGTGKTAAFGLPILNLIDGESNSVQAFILCPTRELCLQIARDLENFSSKMKGVDILAIYGGSSVSGQLRDLRRKPNIIVGTPGRVNDFIKRGALNVSSVKWLVLDEADDMLNMGFKEELDSILANTPEEKQTLLFSATMPKEIQRIANSYMKSPQEISVGSKNGGADTVSHHVYTVRAKDKYDALKRVADMYPKIYGIVFCRTKRETQEIAEKLQSDGYNADALHGDLSQSVREIVMNKFRNKYVQMLVATDVAARGIDVENLSHVINYGLPDETDQYIHRSGRTGRAGKEGLCISIVHSKDKRKLSMIQRRLNKDLENKQIPSAQDICQKQLFNLIDNVENVIVNDQDIEPFMEAIVKKLEKLDREELIKHFVAVEFNKFLDYYKNAKDINYVERSRNSRDRNDRGDRRDRFDRGDRRDRFDRGDRRDRFDRGDRRDRFDGNDDLSAKDRRSREHNARSHRAEAGFTRFFMNVGISQALSPAKLIGILKDLNLGDNLNIGKIDLKENFSFFEVNQENEQMLMKKFKRGVKWGRYNIRVEIAK